MGFFKNLFIPASAQSLTTEVKETAVDPGYHPQFSRELRRGMTEIREDDGMRSIALENYLWKPVAGWKTDNGFTLGTIQDESDHCRALYAINPLIKKAVLARTGLIHGRGNRVVPYEGGKDSAAIDKIVYDHRREVFGPVARARLEAELSTTGNVFVIRSKTARTIVVPIHQIAGYIVDTEDPTEILYWKRSYQTAKTNLETGLDDLMIVTEFVPSSTNKSPVSMIGDTPVRTGSRMLHIAANRQEGWILGLPDVFAAKFWTSGHKEMFEAGHEFALAQGQYAAKVTGGTGMGTQMAASRLADEPRRDYDTGEMSGYGGTFMSSGNMDLQLMGKMGSGVDFKSYDRIAGLIAAATGVPLSVLLAESDSEEKSMEQSVIEDMKLRQQLWGEFYEDFFEGLHIKVVWPRIKQETVYRTQQAVEIANRTNTLKPEEKRLLSLEGFGLEGSASDVPDIEDHPDVMVYRAKKELDLHYAPLIAAATPEPEAKEEIDVKRSTTNDQGNDQKLGKLSDGKDAHEARDNGEQEHTR